MNSEKRVLLTNNIPTSMSRYRTLARQISMVENDSAGYRQLLENLQFKYHTPIIGITGPPGAGKSTLVNALLTHLLAQNNTVAVIAIDPSSPFNYGALLGDRVRLAAHYNNANAYIRSLATRGSLGGLTNKIIEIIDLVRAFGFDYIFVETVGVGQSEVEIAGLAHTTIVTLVPEAGDEIQTMKAGLMEIADIFVVNKSDRPSADQFARNLQKMLHDKPEQAWHIPVLKTIAHQEQGIAELVEQIRLHTLANQQNDKQIQLLTQKAWQLIQQQRMKGISYQQLYQTIAQQINNNQSFNLYTFVANYE